ncbi:thiamine pyrophosphate-dependent enzyme [Moorena sp. SIO4G3]|uniref:thiamine pyrophosphate-dependent enzyme n=1 Tax=Moorena sp. SIO4G3 TaxID=2607821 RepID=UPI001428EA8C|nr:thiamine pyrophosphate-dependent enzyme [Moorena sp. SIO4G3]NEO80021.1 thiamine pyrophosphate-binding protein [Moorena sp. SIO4G3]
MGKHQPQRILVLGTRLGEFTSFWHQEMVPAKGFIHVDLDPNVPGVAYPDVETLAIQGDVDGFIQALLGHLPQHPQHLPVGQFPQPTFPTLIPQSTGRVRPAMLMGAIQRVIVEGSNALIMTEAGNSCAWGSHLLQFTQPGRYRVSTGFGAMGHATTGVVGAAMGHQGKAVAIVGDGAMLMNCEISTAVRYNIPAVWIVLNDARYNMCAQGNGMRGFEEVDTGIPETDFVQFARSMGADGIRVEQEIELEEALTKAMHSTAPFVVDVIIDPTCVAPIGSRVKSLIVQDYTQF